MGIDVDYISSLITEKVVNELERISGGNCSFNYEEDSDNDGIQVTSKVTIESGEINLLNIQRLSDRLNGNLSEKLSKAIEDKRRSIYQEYLVSEITDEFGGRGELYSSRNKFGVSKEDIKKLGSYLCQYGSTGDIKIAKCMHCDGSWVENDNGDFERNHDECPDCSKPQYFQLNSPKNTLDKCLRHSSDYYKNHLRANLEVVGDLEEDEDGNTGDEVTNVCAYLNLEFDIAGVKVSVFDSDNGIDITSYINNPSQIAKHLVAHYF